MVEQNTDFGRVADDLRRAAGAFALLTSQATLLGQSLAAFREFERQIVLTGAIARANAGELQALSAASRSFALVTTATAVEAGQALQNLAQAGFDAQQSIAGLTGVLLLAQATATDVGTASDVLSSNIRAFNLQTSDATRISNLFVAAQNNSLATVEKLTFALRQVGPVAEVAGVNIEETTAFLGELFNIGLRGEQAGTTLRNVIVRLIRPTGEAAEILREFGIATVDATGNFRGLETVLQEIAGANLGEAQLTRIFEQEALAGAIALLNSVSESADGTVSSYRSLLNEISGTNTALEQTLRTLDTFDGQLRLFQNAVSDVAKEIGEALAPVVLELTFFIRDILEAFRELDAEQQQQIAQWLALSTAVVGVLAVFNALILIFGGFATTVFRLARGIGLLAGAFASVTGVASAFAGTLSAFATGGIVAGITAIGASLSALLPLFAALGVVVVGTTAAVRAFRNDTVRTLDDLEDDIRNRDFSIDDSFVGPLNDFQLEVRGASIADRISEFVGTDTAIAEAERRLALADDLINGDLINLIANDDLQSAISASRSAQDLLTDQPRNLTRQEILLVDNLARELEVDGRELQTNLIALRDQERRSVEIANEINNLSLGASIRERLLQLLPGQNEENPFTARALLEEQQTLDLESIPAEQRGAVAAIQEQLRGLTNQRIEAAEAIIEARDAERQTIQRFIDALGDGSQNLGGDFNEFAGLIQQTIRTGAEASADLRAELNALIASDLAESFSAAEIEQLQSIANGGNLVEVLTSIFQINDANPTEQAVTILTEGLLAGQRGISIDTIAQAAVATQREEVVKVFGTLNAANDTLSEIIERQGIVLAEGRLEAAETLEQVLTAANDLFVASISDAFDEFSDRVGADVSRVFGNVGSRNVDLSSVIEEFGDTFNFEDINVNDILNFSLLSDTLTEAVQNADSAEEAERIAQSIATRYQELLRAAVARFQATFDEGVFPEAVQESINQFLEQSGIAIDNLIQVEVDEFEDNLQSGNERVTRGRNRLPDAIRDLREFEDALISAQTTARQASRRFAEAFQGLDVNIRSDLLRNLDVADIVADFDAQLLTLQRSLEELELNSNITGEQRQQIRQQIEQTIAITELARDAEIAATDSFVAQMERRSQAIDNYIDDVRNLAAEGEIPGAVAGIGIAIAEFNRDLIGIADIWQGAVTEGLESISGTLGDVIFEGESLLDGFRETALNISRQVFENFTNAFLQQALSSITGDGGSIFGNALQQAIGGGDANTQLPGVDAINAATATVPPAIAQFTAAIQTGATTGGAAAQNSLQGAAGNITVGGNSVFSALQSIASRLLGVASTLNVGELGGGILAGARQQFTGVFNSLGEVGGGVDGLLDFIRQFEAGGDFNRISSFSRIQPDRPITEFTIDEVLDFQRRNINAGAESSAIGGFQIINQTLEGLVSRLNLTGQEQFTPQLQERLALELLRGRGLDQFAAGEISPEEFGRRVANEWAALPNPFTGQGVFDGDGLNNASAPLDEFMARINSIGDGLSGLGFTIQEGIKDNLPTPDQFISLFEDIVGQFPGLESVGIRPDDLTDGLDAGDVLTGAFDANSVPTDQLNATIAQLNATLSAAGQQLQVSLQQVGASAQAGGQQVRLALTQTGQGVGAGGRQATQALGDTGQGVRTEGGRLVSAIGQTAAGTQAAARTGSSNGFGNLFAGTLTDGIPGNSLSSVGSALTSPEFLFSGFTSLFNFFKDGGYVDPGTEVMSAIRRFNDGGNVMGPGTGTSDDILAFLSNGEFVVNTRDTSNNRQLLEAINNGASQEQLASILLGGSLPAFNTGGLVGGGFEDSATNPLGNFQDFGYLGSKVDPLQSNVNSGNTTMNVTPTYNITIQGGDERSGERFRRSAAQHGKDLGRFIERAKRNS